MKALIKAAAFFSAMVVTTTAGANTTVTAEASGPTREAAINEALGEALIEALGSQVFSVTTMTGDQLESMSTVVSSGRIQDYTIVDEIDIYDGVHVRLSVSLTDQDLSALAPEEVSTWDDKIADTRSLDHAQRTVGRYREVLDEFLVGPRHQLKAGYAFVLRSYDVDRVDSNSVAGKIYVDVAVNQGWWNTYYELVGALIPQGHQIVSEGPITVEGNEAFADPAASANVDAALRYALAHPLPVRVSVGDLSSRFILYKNALLASSRPITEDSAETDHELKQAGRGGISLSKGNIAASEVSVDLERSSLTCGAVSSGRSAIYCGNRFTIGIPFKAKSEKEIIEIMSSGLEVKLDLYGAACHTDCGNFRDEKDQDIDPFELLQDAVDRANKTRL